MYRILILCLCTVLFSAVMAAAQDVNQAAAQDVNQAAAEDVNQADTKDVSQAVNKDASQDINKDKQSEAKELSGMSIVGNDEAPKSLYIVPWKSSEIGVETGMDTMLNEGDMPVDRDVFKRQIEFYQVSTKE